MPWSTPTLAQVRSLVRDSIRGSLPGSDATVPNSVLRVLSDTQGGLCHLTLEYIDWLALQLLPDTAEREWLDRHGQIWLVNADGTIGRKQPTPAIGTVTATGTEGTAIPQFQELLSGNGVHYETTSLAILGALPTPVPVRALDYGTQGNMLAGAGMAFDTPPLGVDDVATVVTVDGGTDLETDDELRARVLKRIREPPMGGDRTDYEMWALSCPGVAKAWCAPLEMGIGTVTVRILMQLSLRPPDGWPTAADLETVTGYVDSVRPVAVKDFWVLAPIKQPIDFQIAELYPDNSEIRAQIQASIQSMLWQLAAPGQTIFAAWKSYAVMLAPGVQSFRLANNNDDVMASPGNMAVLGDIVYV